MLRFLEDADLVEQERDDIHRILFTERKPACEFPFPVDTNIGRDDAGCSSYVRLSSSESLGREMESPSSTNRRSPAMSPTSARHPQLSISKEQINRPIAHIYNEMDGSPKRSDSQTNSNQNYPAPPIMASYAPMAGVPASAGCFSPPFVTGQQGHFFQTALVPQWFPLVHTYANTTAAMGSYPYFLPHVVPRPPAQAPSPMGVIRMPFGSAAPLGAYPPNMCPTQTIYNPARPYFPNPGQYMDIQDDTANSQMKSVNVNEDSASSDCVGLHSPDQSTISPTLDDEKRASCDSPTIVIETDQNATAAASRQQASALMSARSTPVGEAGSADHTPPVELSTTPGADAVSQSPLVSAEARSSPVSVARESDGAPAEIYYDAEDKPLRGTTSPDTTDGDSAGTMKSSNDPAASNSNETESTAATTHKSWASLFKNTNTANSAIVKKVDVVDAGHTKPTNLQSSYDSAFGDMENVVNVEMDPAAIGLAETFRNCEFVNRGPTFMLRGIVNRGNWCYVNACLQALMACPPFYHFLRSLSPYVQRTCTSTPLLDAFVKFAFEFPLLDRSGRVSGGRNLTAIEPTYLYSIISRLRNDGAFKGRQEDAEEFLLQVFNVLHDEMVSCLSLLEKDKGDESSAAPSVNGEMEDADSSEWQQVGPGRKAAITRQMKHTQTPLSQLFLGQLRYGLMQSGAKESANLEPFYTLPLDVQQKDVISALQAFTSRETLKRVSGKTKTEVDATRRVTFHELPRVMIFQLKYFVYTEEGVKKITTPMEYPVDLQVERDLMFNRGKTSHALSRQYKLFAVVFHHGAKAEGGHYTVDIFHGGQWINVDDEDIRQVNNNHVLNFQPLRVPYLLFYRRFDTVGADSQQR